MKKRLFAFTRSLTLSAVAYGVAMGVMQEDRVAGALLLAVYSIIMVVRAYRKPIPLGFFTAMLPGLMALATFLIQLGLLATKNPLPLVGILGGLVCGLLMGKAHQVYHSEERVYTRRTLLYLLVWGFSYGFVQMAGLLGWWELIDVALALTGFTSVSLMVLSLCLYFKFRRERRRMAAGATSAAVAGLMLLILFGSLAPEAGKAQEMSNGTLHSLLKHVVTDKDVLEYFPMLKGARTQTRITHEKDADVIHLNMQTGNYQDGYVGGGSGQIGGRLQISLWVFHQEPDKVPAYISKGWPSCDPENKGHKFMFGDIGYQCGNNETAWGYLHWGLFLMRFESAIFHPAITDDYCYNSLKYLAAVMWQRYVEWARAQNLSSRQPETVDKSNAKPAIAGNDGKPAAPPKASSGSDTQSAASSGGQIQGTVDEESFKRELAEASVVCSLIQLLVAALMAATLAGGRAAGAAAASAPTPASKADTPPPRHPHLIDPDTGEPLVVHSGAYEGGSSGQVWYNGRWMDPAEAQRQIEGRQHQLKARDRERKVFWQDSAKAAEARRQQRARDLHADGYRWDDAQNAWVKTHDAPDEAKVKEFYRRGDWVRDNLDRLAPEQQAAARRILQKAGFKDSGLAPGDISDDELATLRRLTQAVTDLKTGASEMEGAIADQDEANAELTIHVARGTAQIGQMAASRFDPTAGALTGFVFGAAQNWHKGWSGAVGHGLVNGVGNLIDNKIGNRAPESIALNAASGAATNATQAWILGENVKEAAAVGALSGAASAGSTQFQRYMNDARLPRIRPGGDPTLAPGSRGIGSNDLGDLPPSSRPSTPRPDGTVSSDSVRSGASGRVAPPLQEPPLLRRASSEVPPAPQPPTNPGQQVNPTPQGAASTPDTAVASRHVQAPTASAAANGIKDEADLKRYLHQKIADDSKLQRADAMATRLAEGKDPGFDPHHQLPDNADQWSLRDQALGVPPRDPMPLPGVERTPHIQNLIDTESGKYPWLNSVDREIRDAWQQVGGGREPDAWNRFQKVLDRKMADGSLQPGDLDRWHQLSHGQQLQRTPEQAAGTFVPKTPPSPSGEGTHVPPPENPEFDATDD